jgi:hypothetical protein
MGMSNFPNGIMSAGVPILGGSYIPPITGDYFHVCPGLSTIINYKGKQVVGSSGNSGESIYAPLDSIATAYGKCTSGAGDGIILWSYGTTTAATTSYLTSALTWSKHGITTVGICAPTMMSQRARVANKSTSTDLANLATISGNNNTFINMSWFNGGTTGAGGLLVSGSRNYFNNVHIMGGMGMTTPTIADYSLTLQGQENTFDGCVIGSDTFDKSDIAAGELILSGGGERNRFRDCEFLSYRTAGTTAGLILLSGGDCITRHIIFDNCTFTMYRDGSITAEVAVVIGTAPNNGFIIFKNCTRHGFTSWAPVANARVYSATSDYTATGGKTILSTT